MCWCRGMCRYMVNPGLVQRVVSGGHTVIRRNLASATGDCQGIPYAECGLTERRVLATWSRWRGSVCFGIEKEKRDIEDE